jgi:hypothetical protein
MKKFKVLILISVLAAGFFIANTALAIDDAGDDTDGDVSQTGGSNATETESPSDTNAYELQIPLFDYTKSQNIAEYILTIYRYVMIVLIPILIIMIIYAGIIWIGAGGDSGKINQAKDRIKSGFIGMGLALLSYVILSLIGIDALNMPGLETIQKEVGDDLEFYQDNFTMPGLPGSYPSVGGQCFPVAGNSFDHNSNNFKAPRSGGGRYHAGVDLYTKGPGIGVAIADGVVTRISTTFKAGPSRCTRTPNWWISQNGGPGDAGAILIYHPSLGVTANYGEHDIKNIKVKAGDNVKAGQVLSVFGPCRMIHFELYKGKQSGTTPWYSGNPQPPNLLDPTNTLKALEGKICG